MAQIGTFTRVEDGSYAGTIRTLSLNIKLRFVPAEPSRSIAALDDAALNLPLSFKGPLPRSA